MVSLAARCGQTTSLNNTYFASRTSGDSSPCSLRVCRANTNICQIRLDFETFNIEGPVTSTTSAGGRKTIKQGEREKLTGDIFSEHRHCV